MDKKKLDIVPRIEVLGVYLPTADQQRFEKFISESITDFSTPSSEDRTIISELRPGINLDEELRVAAIHLEEDLRRNLDSAALIEILIMNPNQSFDMGSLIQRNPAIPESHWQVAYKELFLTLDGSKVIGSEMPSDSPICRAVFYIHDWQPALGLDSCYGSLTCPAPQPMPERLWSLAPYELP